VGILVVQAALEKVFTEYFGFPYHLCHWLLHTYHSLSRAGAIGQIIAEIPREYSLTPLQLTNKKLHDALFFKC
jgi:hypothetical protein